MNALVVDEHVWRHVSSPRNGLVTGIVEHSRGQDGRPRARPLDLVNGRSGAAYGHWLTEQWPEFTARIRTAMLDRFHGYANAIPHELPEAITVLDASTWSSSAGKSLTRSDAGCSRTPWFTAGGSVTRTTAFGVPCKLGSSTSPPSITRLNTKLAAGDPHHEVTLAWQCNHKLRAAYHASPEQGRRLATYILTAFLTCPIPEVARLGRTLRRWRSAILSHFDTHRRGIQRPTEAINGVIELMSRVARGFRILGNNRLLALLSAGGFRPGTGSAPTLCRDDPFREQRV